jgi:site-specific DNA-cytosine methylase
MPRWKDVRDVEGDKVRRRCGRIDLVTGGFPCTGISNIGRGEGVGTAETPTEASGLFWQFLRVVREVRPLHVLIENVPSLRTRGGDTVLDAMGKHGYAGGAVVVGGQHVGAPHRRNRAWIVGRLADTNGFGGSEQVGSVRGRKPHLGGLGTPVSRWPARPGERQHDWEAPRLIQPPNRHGRPVLPALNAKWSSQFMGLPEDWLVLDKPRHNRLAIKALGNANPPALIAAVGRAIVRANSPQEAGYHRAARVACCTLPCRRWGKKL